MYKYKEFIRHPETEDWKYEKKFMFVGFTVGYPLHGSYQLAYQQDLPAHI